MRRFLSCALCILLLPVLRLAAEGAAEGETEGAIRHAVRGAPAGAAAGPSETAEPARARMTPGRQSADEDSERVALYRAAVEQRDRPVDSYNLGTALLLDGRAGEAREPLQRANESARDRVRLYGQYNLGVASGLVGRTEGSPEARRSALLAARQAFRQVLRDDPSDENARWNLELIEKWLEEAEQSSGGRGGGEQPQSRAGGPGAEQGEAGDAPQRPLTPDEAAALLQAAGEAEQSIRDRFLGRNRFREPTVERNW